MLRTPRELRRRRVFFLPDRGEPDAVARESHGSNAPMMAERVRRRRRIGRLSIREVNLMITMTGLGIVRDEKAECSNSRNDAQLFHSEKEPEGNALRFQ